jgi:hypothetical protein
MSVLRVKKIRVACTAMSAPRAFPVAQAFNEPKYPMDGARCDQRTTCPQCRGEIWENNTWRCGTMPLANGAPCNEQTCPKCKMITVWEPNRSNRCGQQPSAPKVSLPAQFGSPSPGVVPVRPPPPAGVVTTMPVRPPLPAGVVTTMPVGPLPKPTEPAPAPAPAPGVVTTMPVRPPPKPTPPEPTAYLCGPVARGFQAQGNQPTFTFKDTRYACTPNKPAN